MHGFKCLLSVSAFLCLSVCMCRSVSVCVFLCLSVCLSFFLFLSLSLFLFLSLFFSFFLSLSLSCSLSFSSSSLSLLLGAGELIMFLPVELVVSRKPDSAVDVIGAAELNTLLLEALVEVSSPPADVASNRLSDV